MEERNWLVEKDEYGRWVGCWNGDWLPNTYGSKEEALIALLDHLNEDDE